jgi:hypothetical protein
VFTRGKSWGPASKRAVRRNVNTCSYFYHYCLTPLSFTITYMPEPIVGELLGEDGCQTKL